MTRFSSFDKAINSAYDTLKNWGQVVPVSRWQGVETGGHFREVTFFSFEVPVHRGALRSSDHPLDILDLLQVEIKPNLPWADDHFLERVSGEPLNPGEQYKNWPHWRGESEDISLEGGKFSHTYMERFWPVYAGGAQLENIGIRFRLGDLSDVVKLLYEDPYTRQAYVPIWFPEDTGAVHQLRVPCSIGYFFLMRNDHLHMRYHIRSCDFNRYLRDDIYMAVRLQLWMLDQLQTTELQGDHEQLWVDVKPGTFIMDIDSLHVLGGDFHVKS